jgi:transcriptional regulator of met regulon
MIFDKWSALTLREKKDSDLLCAMMDVAVEGKPYKHLAKKRDAMKDRTAELKAEVDEFRSLFKEMVKRDMNI